MPTVGSRTPAGHHIVQMVRDGQPWTVGGQPVMRAEIVDFWSLVLNPSTLDRLTHSLIGAFIMGAFFIMSISAYYLLRRRHEEFARRSFTGALIFGTIFSLAQLASGHSNAQMVAQQQPAKLAAFEGLYQTGPGRLSLMGWPNEEQRRLDFEMGVPGMLSFLVHGDSTTPVMGLDKVPQQYWPPVKVPFISYHVMVGLGMFFITLTLVASFLRWRGKLFEHRWLMWVFVFAVIGPVLANELGWASAEVGRQPWTVHPRVVRDDAGSPILDVSGMIQYRLEEGLLTRSAVSETLKGPEVLASIVMFSAIYLLLLAIWVLVLNHKIHNGPQPVAISAGPHPGGMRDSQAQRVDHGSSMSGEKQKGQG